MVEPEVRARGLAADAEDACAALMAYAARLDDLKTIREQLAADITAHQEKAAAVSQDTASSGGDAAAIHQQESLCAEAALLEGRVTRFTQALEDAQQECSRRLNVTWGDPLAGQTGDPAGVSNTVDVATARWGRDVAGQDLWNRPDSRDVTGSLAAMQLMRGGGSWNSLPDGVVNFTGPGNTDFTTLFTFFPLLFDPRLIKLYMTRAGRYRSGKPSQETGENSEAMGLGTPIPGESAPMPRPEPWKYPGDSENEGSGPHAQRGANLGDHMKHEAATSAAFTAGSLWPDAARNLTHFLNNSGAPLDMHTDGMLKDLPTLQEKVKTDLKIYADAAVKDAKTSGHTGPVTYPFVTNWQPEEATGRENMNWYYTVGGYHHATAGTITVYPDGSYTYKYQVHTADRYNWDGKKNFDIGPINVSDTELQELHRAGIAQEYDLVGESEVRTGP